jgi:ubiquitin-conjugating enzyme E2 D/E
MVSTDIEGLAKQLGSRESGGMQLVDADNVRQVIHVCFDSSGSMAGDHAGNRCDTRRGDVPRVTIAAQYLTTFANRTYGYRVPCIQGLIAFNDELTVKCPLSPLVPDFEDGIRRVVPSSTTHLWDALKKAADDLVAFAAPGGNRKFPNADLRILVISDGEDVGSSTTPLQALQAMINAKVICDSVIVSSEDCRKLRAVCHLTGGLSFKPPSVAEGLKLFEQEAFLCYDKRKKPPRFRGTITEQTIIDFESDDGHAFDKVAESSTTVIATGRLPLAVPRYVLFMNRSQEIPDARRRRILRELHQAAAVQDSASVGHDPDGNEIQLFDPDLVIFPFRAHLDQWRVYVRGLDGTPYAGKWWYIYVTFPDEYPVRPPVFRFISIPYHMNVSSEGRICLNVIEKGYMPNMPVVELLQTIKQLFLIPDTTTPLDMAKLFQYKDQRAEYDRLARQSTAAEAKPTAEDWYRDLSIERDVPDTYSIQIGEQIPPYLRSGFSGKFIPKERRAVGPGGVVYDRAEIDQIRAASDAPICPITGKPLITDDLFV